ncbi:uncharacterized protein BXZ73DRAFT_9683, partial [Epithele typhae]|uniref:uncharacterized protein n=1 Tax=Epithele typhae TaxID=378194 RepID=UPI002007BA9D
WKPYIHPEGSVYFRYKASANYFTNEWLYDDEKHKLIETTLALFEDQVRTEELDPKDWEICLSIWVDKDTEDTLGCYYICDMEKREVFYIHEVEQSFFIDSLDEVEIQGREHLGRSSVIHIHREHVFMFPHGRVIQKEMVEELLAELTWLTFDLETSKSSTAPYGASDLARFHNIMKDIECDSQCLHCRPQYVATYARIQSTIHIERTIRYYGERYAQLDVFSSIRAAPPPNTSILFKIATYFFFFTPEIYLERLNKAWVNRMVNPQYWRKFIEDTQADWQGSITPTTVILAANLSFLAIQSVDQNGESTPTRSMGQIVSYLSLFLSMGSIFSIAILERQHRHRDHHHAEDAMIYLQPRAMTPRGVEMLAIMFSIPTALFLWGLVAFFIAISWLCFWHTARSVWIIIVSFVSVFALLIALVLLDSKPSHGAAAATPTDIIRARLARTAR